MNVGRLLFLRLGDLASVKLDSAAPRWGMGEDGVGQGSRRGVGVGGCGGNWVSGLR